MTELVNPGWFQSEVRKVAGTAEVVQVVEGSVATAWEELKRGNSKRVTQDAPNLCLRIGGRKEILVVHTKPIGFDLYWVIKDDTSVDHSCLLMQNSLPVGTVIIGSSPSVEGVFGRMKKQMVTLVKAPEEAGRIDKDQLAIAFEAPGEYLVTNLGREIPIFVPSPRSRGLNDEMYKALQSIPFEK